MDATRGVERGGEARPEKFGLILSQEAKRKLRTLSDDESSAVERTTSAVKGGDPGATIATIEALYREKNSQLKQQLKGDAAFPVLSFNQLTGPKKMQKKKPKRRERKQKDS